MSYRQTIQERNSRTFLWQDKARRLDKDYLFLVVDI